MGWSNDQVVNAGTGSAVGTSEGTTSLAITDLATPGPSVTLNVRSSGIAVVFLDFRPLFSSTAAIASMWCVITGAGNIQTIGPVTWKGTDPDFVTTAKAFIVTGLNPGSVTFKAQYSSDGTNTASFNNRNIQVLAL